MARHVIARGVFAALFVVLCVPVSYGQVSGPLADKAADANRLATLATLNPYIRVIVEFERPLPAGPLRHDPAVLATLKTRIAAAQDAILRDVFGDATNPREGQGFPRGLSRFEITAGFALNVNGAELYALASHPNVIRIHEDVRFDPVLLQSVPLIGMPKAYALGAAGDGRAVAIIDSGVQSNHEFLLGKVVMEACFDQDSGPFPMGGCPNGQSTQTGPGAAAPTIDHGTHVAGIAAGNNTASALNGAPPSGVAKGAAIVAVQVLSGSGGGTLSDAISGLDWIFQNALTPGGATLDAVNMSFAAGHHDSPCDSAFSLMKASIDNLTNAGVAVVAAAGNQSSTTQTGAPACLSNVIAVAARTNWTRSTHSAT
jgi:subtilisin family serine protease